AGVLYDRADRRARLQLRLADAADAAQAALLGTERRGDLAWPLSVLRPSPRKERSPAAISARCGARGRRGRTRPCARSISISRRASSWCCWAPPAAANPPCFT